MKTLISTSTLISTLTLALISSIAFLISCKAVPSLAEMENLPKVIELEKAPCFGDCSVYTLTIYENGLMQYKGDENTDKEGVFVKNMPQNDLRKLVKAFRDADFFSFQSAYRSNIPDLQTITITFNDNGRNKVVTGKDNRPEALMELQSMLEEIADSEDWKYKEGRGGDDETFSTEIIVNLVRGVNTEDWLDKYKAQNVRIKEALSPTGNYIVITFDPEIITPEDMLSRIRNDEEVIGAEFNREVYNR